MSSKTKTKQQTDQTQTAAPPSFTLPGITDASGRVTAALDQLPANHYVGQQIATRPEDELAAIKNAYGSTADLAGGYVDYLNGQLPSLSTPFSFSTSLPATSYDIGNQFDVNPAIESALHPLYQQLTEQLLPSIKSSALESGAYTGDRAMMVLPEQAIQAYTDSAARTAADIGYENYNDFQNRRLAAFQASSQAGIDAYNAETSRGLGEEGQNTSRMGAISDYVNNILHTSASVGDLLRMGSDLGVQNNQATIDDLLARDKYAHYAPFMGLDEASQLLAQLSGNYGTQTMNGTTTTTTKQSPGALDLLKAGIGAAGLIAGIPFGGAAAAAAAPAMISPTAGAQLGSAMANSIFGG